MMCSHYKTYNKTCVILFVLRFYSQVNTMGSCRATKACKTCMTSKDYPIWNFKLAIHNINAQIKLGVNPLIFTQVIIRKWKYGPVVGRYLCQKLTQFAHQKSQTSLYNINFCENPLTFTQGIIRKQKYRQTDGWTTERGAVRLIDIRTTNVKA